MAVPIVTYGSITWTIAKKGDDTLKRQKMKFLKRVEGCTPMDRARNDTIR